LLITLTCKQCFNVNIEIKHITKINIFSTFSLHIYFLQDLLATFWECKICQKTFKNARRLKEHEMHNHKKYSCDKCNFQSYSDCKFKDHECVDARISRKREICCREACLQSENSASEYVEHDHKRSTHLYYICPTCNQKFTSKKSLKKHIKQKHPNSFICRHCSSVFSSLKDLRYHQQLSHPVFKCLKCNYKTYIECRMTKHVCHFNRGYGCTLCKKFFVTKFGLQQHLSIHDRLKFQCQFCKTRYATETIRDSHEKEKHFCTSCSKNFKNLRYHAKMVHQTTKNFVCQHCTKVFKSASNLSRHFKKCSFILIEPININNFIDEKLNCFTQDNNDSSQQNIKQSMQNTETNKHEQLTNVDSLIHYEQLTNVDSLIHYILFEESTLPSDNNDNQNDFAQLNNMTPLEFSTDAASFEFMNPENSLVQGKDTPEKCFLFDSEEYLFTK